MEKLFFDSWESLVRIFVLTVSGYVSLIFMLRLSGKRTLSKMNAFDFVITIALGSMLSALSLNKDISLADGVLSLAVLVLLQFLLTWLSVRSQRVYNVLTNKPVMIYYQQEFLAGVMKRERITVDEVFASARQKGLSTFDEVQMVIVEPTGELTFVQYSSGKQSTAKGFT